MDDQERLEKAWKTGAFLQGTRNRPTTIHENPPMIGGDAENMLLLVLSAIADAIDVPTNKFGKPDHGKVADGFEHANPLQQLATLYNVGPSMTVENQAVLVARAVIDGFKQLDSTLPKKLENVRWRDSKEEYQYGIVINEPKEGDHQILTKHSLTGRVRWIKTDKLILGSESK